MDPYSDVILHANSVKHANYMSTEQEYIIIGKITVVQNILQSLCYNHV